MSAPCSRAAFEDPVRRDHDAEVDDLVVVAGEDDADDVLADVVDVPLDGREEDLPLRPAPSPAAFSRLEEGRAGTATAFFMTRALLTTCGRNIFPEPKRSPTTFIPAMSGPSMTASGRAVLLPRLLGVSASTWSTMPLTRAWARRSSTGPRSARRRACDRGLLARAFTVSAKATSRSVASGRRFEEDVLDPLEEVLRDLLVDRELAGVDDPHVEAGADGVVEEGRVHRLADGVVAAERERDVRDAAARPSRAGSSALIRRVASKNARA